MVEKEIRRREWADLPRELIQMIWERMDYSRVDALRLRSVCSTWRSSVPPPSFRTETPPVILSHPRSWRSYLPPRPFPRFSSILKEATICRIQLTTSTATTDDDHNKQAAKSTWLIKVVESSKGQLQLLHSLTHVQLNPRGPIPLSLDNASFVPVARYFSLGSTPWCWASRIILFPATARLADNNFTVLAIFDGGTLRYWRPGDEDWMLLDDKIFNYQDLVVRNGKYYVVDMAGTVSWIDENLRLVQYSPPLYRLFGSRKSLVESQGELYVVDRYLYREGVHVRDLDPPNNNLHRLRRRRRRRTYRMHGDTMAVDFRVYRLDEERGRWEKVKSLGNRSFVLGADCSFSFDAMELFGGKGNCIYFTDDERCQIGKPSSWDRVGLFQLEDWTVDRLVRLPEYSQLLWPPPGLEGVQLLDHSEDPVND